MLVFFDAKDRIEANPSIAVDARPLPEEPYILPNQQSDLIDPVQHLFGHDPQSPAVPVRKEMNPNRTMKNRRGCVVRLKHRLAKPNPNLSTANPHPCRYIPHRHPDVFV